MSEFFKMSSPQWSKEAQKILKKEGKLINEPSEFNQNPKPEIPININFNLVKDNRQNLEFRILDYIYKNYQPVYIKKLYNLFSEISEYDDFLFPEIVDNSKDIARAIENLQNNKLILPLGYRKFRTTLALQMNWDSRFAYRDFLEKSRSHMQQQKKNNISIERKGKGYRSIFGVHNKYSETSEKEISEEEKRLLSLTYFEEKFSVAKLSEKMKLKSENVSKILESLEGKNIVRKYTHLVDAGNSFVQYEVKTLYKRYQKG